MKHLCISVMLFFVCDIEKEKDSVTVGMNADHIDHMLVCEAQRKILFFILWCVVFSNFFCAVKR